MPSSRSHRFGFLSLTETRAETNSFALDGDLLIVISNAEERCLEVSKTKSLKFPRVKILQFNPVNRVDERKENFNKLSSVLKSHGQSVSDFQLGSIVDYKNVFDRLQSLIIQEREIVGRSLSITIDISCLPKHYAIYFVGFSVKFSIAYELKLFYAEADYKSISENPEVPDLNPKFSVGRWEAIVIPFFEGELVLESRSRLIALLGFETLEASRFIHSYQADQYAMILALASFNETYADRAIEDGKTLARDFDVPDDMIFSAEAGSALNVLTIFNEYFKNSDGRANLVVCLGTKPHALGAALHSILQDNFSIICRVPSAYPEFHTEPTGYSWLYEVNDLSSLYQPINF